MLSLLLSTVLQSLAGSSAAAPQAAEPFRPAIQRFLVDAQASEAGFDGSSTLHDFTGRTRKITGEVRLEPARLALAGGRIAIEAASLDTNSKGRDEDMRETLEVEKFPEIRFDLGSTRGAWSPAKCRLEITGRFSIHGVERETKLAVDVEGRADGGLHLTGKAKLDIEDFGVEPPSMLFVTMDDEVKVWFDLVLQPAKSELRPAASRSIELAEERLDEKGASLGRTSETGRLWVDGERLLWERPAAAQWILRTAAGSIVVDHHRVGIAGVARSAEEELEDEIHPPARPNAGNCNMHVPHVPGRLERVEGFLALLPSGAAMQAETEGNRTSFSLGEREWARLEGLAGEAHFAELLLVAPGIPTAVREALVKARGVPLFARFTTVTPDAMTVRGIRIGPEEPGLLPEWTFELVQPAGAAKK